MLWVAQKKKGHLLPNMAATCGARFNCYLRCVILMKVVQVERDAGDMVSGQLHRGRGTSNHMGKCGPSPLKKIPPVKTHSTFNKKNRIPGSLVPPRNGRNLKKSLGDGKRRAILQISIELWSRYFFPPLCAKICQQKNYLDLLAFLWTNPWQTTTPRVVPNLLQEI